MGVPFSFLSLLIFRFFGFLFVFPGIFVLCLFSGLRVQFRKLIMGGAGVGLQVGKGKQVNKRTRETGLSFEKCIFLQGIF